MITCAATHGQGSPCMTVIYLMSKARVQNQISINLPRHKRIRKSEAPYTLSIAIMIECGFNALVPALIFSVNKVSYQ